MKKAAALILVTIMSTSAWAQSLALDLNREGIFEKKSQVVLAASKKKITKSSTRVHISKTSENSYILMIQKVGTNARSCLYQAQAFPINQVQMISNIEDCEVTVGYTSPTNLAIMTNGQCSDFCSANAKLETSDVRRVSGVVRK